MKNFPTEGEILQNMAKGGGVAAGKKMSMQRKNEKEVRNSQKVSYEISREIKKSKIFCQRGTKNENCWGEEWLLSR